MKTAGILGAAVVLGVFLMIEIIREMHTFRVVHYCIESPKLMGMKRARRAVFLTDLHNYCYGENNARLYQAIVDAKPDVIFIGGDMLVRKDGCSFGKTAEFLGKLPGICDVYCANGNHEQKLKEWPKKYRQSYQEYRKLLTNAGIIMLENDCAELLWDETNVKLTGLEIPLYGYSRFGKKQIPVSELKRRIGQADESYQILLAHNPDYMDQYLEWGADLVLSGHLHGGIVAPVGWRCHCAEFHLVSEVFRRTLPEERYGYCGESRTWRALYSHSFVEPGRTGCTGISNLWK